jgi:A/G-specific adenine glycosylase
MPVSKSAKHHSASELTPQKRTALVTRLLAWYDGHRRRLPWRALPGETADPYRVWLSEIMLQQTMVAAVGPYFHKFVKKWPTMKALAAAPVEEVMSAWAGLGYYSRARNLHACAKQVAERHGGKLPDTEEALRALPGIGPYTAAAIAAIAFDRSAAPVDGNIERVLARLFAIKTPLPASKPELRAIAETLAPAKRSGDFAQAMMDLGATICTPKTPACRDCPWSDDCLARDAARPRSQTRPPVAARHRIRAGLKRREHIAAPPAAEGAAGRDARAADEPMGEGLPRRCAEARAAQSQVPQTAGRRAARLHALRTRTARVLRRRCRQSQSKRGRGVGADRRSRPLRPAQCHAQSDRPRTRRPQRRSAVQLSENTCSIGIPNTRAILNASGRDGSYLPVSIAFTLWRET